MVVCLGFMAAKFLKWSLACAGMVVFISDVTTLVIDFGRNQVALGLEMSRVIFGSDVRQSICFKKTQLQSGERTTRPCHF